MILSLVLGFVAGIAIGSFSNISLDLIIVLAVLATIFFIYRYFVPEKNRLVLTFATLALLGVILGIARMNVSDLYSESQLDSFVGKPIFAEGIVVSEPDVREHNTKLTIKLSQIEKTPGLPCSEPLPCTEHCSGTAVCSITGLNEKILVTVPIYPEYSYGDKVKMNVTLVAPKEIKGEDGRTFDYGGYLRVRGIWYVSNFAKVELIESGHGAYVKTLLFKIKHSFTNALNDALPEPESSLLSGLLLGTKQSLGKNLLLEFQRSGVSHVVVLSGYNIAIVANSIMSVLAFLPKLCLLALELQALFYLQFLPVAALQLGGRPSWF